MTDQEWDLTETEKAELAELDIKRAAASLMMEANFSVFQKITTQTDEWWKKVKKRLELPEQPYRADSKTGKVRRNI